MDKSQVEWRLIIIWCIGAILVFSTLLVQHFGGAFGSDATRAWGWYTAMVLPTPLLLVGSFMSAERPGSVVDPRTVTLVTALSVLYLTVLEVATVRYAFQSSRNAVDLLVDSTLFVSPLQGVASLAFGRLLGNKDASTTTAPSLG